MQTKVDYPSNSKSVSVVGYLGNSEITSSRDLELPEFLNRSSSAKLTFPGSIESDQVGSTKMSLPLTDAAIIDDVLLRRFSSDERNAFFQTVPEADGFPTIALASFELMAVIVRGGKKTLSALKKHQASSSRARGFKKSNPANIALQVVTNAITQPERNRCSEHAYSLLHAEMEGVLASDLTSFLANHTNDSSKRAVCAARRNGTLQPKLGKEIVGGNETVACHIHLDTTTLPGLTEPGRHIIKVEVLTSVSPDGKIKFLARALGAENQDPP